MAIAALTNNLLKWGVLAIVILGPLQVGIEVAPKIHLSLVDPVIWSLFALWLYDCVTRRCVKRFRVEPALGLFLVLVAVATIRIPPKLRSIKEAVQMFEYFGAAWLMVRSHTRSWREMRNLLVAISAIASGVLAVALWQYFADTEAAFLVRGTFANRNALGGYLGMVVPLLFSVALHAPSAAWRIWAAVIVAAGIVVLLSGGAALAITAGCLAVAAAKGRWHLVVTTVCVGLLAIGILPYLPRDNARVLYESIRFCDDEGNISQRYIEWQAAGTMIAEFPWRGVGPDLYQENIGSYYGTLPNPPCETSEHDSQNLYLVIGSSMGIPALLAFISILTGGMTSGFIRAANCRMPWACAAYWGVVGSLISFAVASIWSPLLVRGVGILLAVLLALAHADISDEDESNNWSGRRESNP